MTPGQSKQMSEKSTTFAPTPRQRPLRAERTADGGIYAHWLLVVKLRNLEPHPKSRRNEDIPCVVCISPCLPTAGGAHIHIGVGFLRCQLWDERQCEGLTNVVTKGPTIVVAAEQAACRPARQANQAFNFFTACARVWHAAGRTLPANASGSKRRETKNEYCIMKNEQPTPHAGKTPRRPAHLLTLGEN